MLPNLGHNVGCERRSTIVHCKNHSLNLQLRVQVALHELHISEKLAHSLECVVLTLDWNEYLVGRSEPVYRKKAERWRTIDENEVEVVDRVLDRIAEASLAGEHRDQLDLGTGEFNRRGENEEVAHRRRFDSVFDGHVLDEHVIGRVLDRRPVDPQATRRIALRIKVLLEDPFPLKRKPCTKIDRGGGLANASLLVGDGNSDSGH